MSHIFFSALKVFAITCCLCLLYSCQRSYQNYNFVPEPELASINIIDRNGLTETINNPDRLEQYENVDFLQPQPYQKVLRIYKRLSDSSIPANITSYHSNGYVKQYLEVVNSRACGAYKEWYANGTQKILANVIEGTADLVDGAERTWLFDGDCQVWDENGHIKATISYSKGLLNGPSMHYHANGNVWKTISYVSNNINGKQEIYRPDGTLLQTTTFVNGVKEGEARRYWMDNQIAAEEIYCEGLLSFGRYYDSTGTLIASIDEGTGIRALFAKDAVSELQEYFQGIQEGKVKGFDKYGRVCRLYHLKNGCKHGEEIGYFEANRFQPVLNPKLSINWYDGKIQGIVKTWYENGQQESQREISHNKKNGHSTAWYQDSSLMMIEDYQQDVLDRGDYFNRGEKFPISTVLDGEGTATLFDSEGNFIRKILYHHGKPLLDE